ncbi:ArsR/SmtB family transcription factor [Halorarum halobium]|uniref:ArsR/SmtB family transcription factor n=1 Tax=Halorarum halobium TaxID=3075121 RepID=UPI0028B22D58|nr:helix-turn-helix domain-containing protein [Halobaculum sp. XH14]
MSERDKATWEDLAEVYKSLGNEARLAVILQLDEGESVSQLTDELGMTRSGLQKNIERLIDAGLVYRPTDSDQTYELTVLGEFFVNEVREEKQHVDQVLEDFQDRLAELEEEEEETLQRMEDAGVDTKELENKLRAEAWEELQDQR